MQGNRFKRLGDTMIVNSRCAGWNRICKITNSKTISHDGKCLCEIILMNSHSDDRKHKFPLAFIYLDIAKIMLVICSASHVFFFLILILASKLFFATTIWSLVCYIFSFSFFNCQVVMSQPHSMWVIWHNW